VVDAAGVQFSSMDSIAEGQPVCLLGIQLHVLTRGATFNLHTRLADAGGLRREKE
jgi:cyanophycinase